ncbi:hypothetical protein AVL50_31115 [Flammeovirga sp. SJP92]|nr:hypothetical protein AVL50_31115 [Flammeovirga sp. SJP92]
MPSKDYNVLFNDNDSVFYIGGRSSKLFLSEDKSSVDSSINKTILYYSLDICKNWNKIDINFTGNVSHLHVEGDTLIVANQFLKMPSNILYSTNLGQSWESLISLDSSKYIQDIAYNNTLGVVTAVRGNTYLNLLALKNGVVDTLINFPKSHYNLELLDNKAFFIAKNENTNVIIIFDYETKEVNQIALNNNHRVVCKGTDTEGNLLLVLEEEKNRNVILRINTKIERIELGDFAEYRVNRISGNSKRIYLDVHEEENKNILGVKHELIFTENEGKSWIQEDYPISQSTKPFTTLVGGGYITYSAFGEFQRLN